MNYIRQWCDYKRDFELYQSVRNKDVQSAIKHLKNGANPNNRIVANRYILTALDCAILNNDIDMVTLLIDHQAKPNHYCWAIDAPIYALSPDSAMGSLLITKGVLLNSDQSPLGQ